jgi:hypothetical protein
MTTELPRNPFLSLLFLLLTRVSPVVVLADLFWTSVAAWFVYRTLHDVEAWMRWTASGVTWVFVQLAGLPLWIAFALATAGTLSVQRVGLARHFLDLILTMVAERWSEAETFRTGMTLGPEFRNAWDASASTLADQYAAGAPGLLRAVLRRLILASCTLLRQAAIALLEAEEGPDGSVRLLAVPRMLGRRFDTIFLRYLWIWTLAISLVSIGLQTALITGIITVAQQFLAAPPPLEPVKVE